MKRILIALILVWSSSAWATGGHVIKPVIVKPPVVVTPPVTAPPPAPVAVPPPSSVAAPSAPAQAQPSGGGGNSSWLAKGGLVMIGVAVFFYAVICTSERHRNPGTWFSEHCRPQDWVK